jgi:hypothetical protein
MVPVSTTLMKYGLPSVTTSTSHWADALFPNVIIKSTNKIVLGKKFILMLKLFNTYSSPALTIPGKTYKINEKSISKAPSF